MKPTQNTVDKLCRPGEEADTCCYLIRTATPNSPLSPCEWDCARNYTVVQAMIDMKIDAGEMVAQRRGCKHRDRSHRTHEVHYGDVIER